MPKTTPDDGHVARRGPLPLVVGVTGHRDLRASDYPSLEERVREIFVLLLKEYEHTPITLLSPLAEGADRLTARVALDLGVQLIVPLPMPRELYEADFTAEGSLAEFRELIARAESAPEIELVGGHTEEEVSNPLAARNALYENVGAYIVGHCQILIALWDGVDLGLTGGTSSIVKFQTGGLPRRYDPTRNPLDAVERGPVKHIITPRVKNPQPEGEPFAVKDIFPSGGPANMDAFRRIARHIDAFNADALKHAEILDAKQAENMESLFPEERAKLLPEGLRTLREHYGVADTLAIYFQQQTRRTLKRLYRLVAVAAVAFGVYAHLLTKIHPLLVVYLLILAVAHFGVHRFAQRRKYQSKYQDYRTLAEGIRVQFFWCLANLRMSVADRYLRKQKSELDWIRNATRVWNIPRADDDRHERTTTTPASDKHTFRLVLKYWISNQAKYFSRTTKKEHALLHRYERLTKFLVRAGVVFAILLAVALGVSYFLDLHLSETIAHNHTLHGVIILLMTLPPVGAALLHSYTDKTALSEHVKQYGRMGAVFGGARLQMVMILRRSGGQHSPLSTEEAEEARKLTEDLGIEALAENADWVLLHRERPIDPPHAA
ncbi:MAG TPA: hypothetical protein VFX96_11530 [Pyrinomonadaceae bacterium]|nr:hypothetical protein [Pyrinomonadaceae bacterium]